MKVAFLSDIHANLEALDAVAEFVKELPVICLGDLVGYAANPNEVVDWARSKTMYCLMGNHDSAVVGGDISWFNLNAQKSILWTRGVITPRNLSYLSNLSPILTVTLEGAKFVLAHGSPLDPLHEYVYEETHEQLFQHYLERFSVDAVALGHTHVPFVWRSKHGLVFNTGSVGQPRNRNPKASLMMAEISKTDIQLEHIYVDYDRATTSRKILEQSLPRFHAERLLLGI